MTIEEAASIGHEVNRAYCIAIGDNSQLPWDKAPLWQLNSAMDGVRAIISGNIKEPSESHENWLKTKRGEGWVYGDTKNPDEKRHPCMLQFDDLPQEQRTKDFLFFGTVKHLESMGIEKGD